MNWRLIIDGPHSAAANMAIDAAILDEHGRGQVPPTLRFYSWETPTVSIGYFQDLEKEIDVEACNRRGVGLVRRPTGGRAVLHHREVTYSVVTSAGFGASTRVLTSYQWLSGGLARGLERLGLAVTLHRPEEGSGAAGRITGSAACFDSPSWYEITVGGKKIIGSAQVRRDEALLQHGSILLETQARELFELLRFGSESIRARMCNLFESRATGISEALGRPVGVREVVDAMVGGFREALGLTLEPGGLTSREEALAGEFVREKYGNPLWISERGKSAQTEASAPPAKE